MSDDFLNFMFEHLLNRTPNKEELYYHKKNTVDNGYLKVLNEFLNCEEFINIENILELKKFTN
jgi:hypothetical protein